MAYPTPDIWMKFEQNGKDSSGNNNHTSVVGSPTYSTSKEGLGFCKGPESVANNYYNAPNIGITGADLWTIAMWLEYPSNYGRIWEYGTETWLRFIQLELSAGHPGNLSMGFGGGKTFTGYTFIPGNWYHVAITFHPGPPTPQWFLYVDGSYIQFLNVGFAINILEGFHRVSRQYLGKIDNFMIWQGLELTEAQVQEVMNETNPPPPTVSIGGFTGKNVIIGG